MPAVTVTLLQSEAATTQCLVDLLYKTFRTVRQAQSFGDLRISLAEYPSEIVILDLEVASFPELKGLLRDFPGISVVCNHRLADEEMWAASLSAGAVDCCASSDTQGILRAASQNYACGRIAA
jgi:DNA-binding NarL/FixJ family response regulator